MDGEQPFERWELKGIWRSRTCPRRIITPESVALIQLFQHYQAGHLAVAGGVLEQPARYFQAMHYLSQIWESANA